MKRDFYTVPVYYATDRNIVSKEDTPERIKVTYGSDREKSGQLHYGMCVVTIPKTHEKGKIESPPFYHFWSRDSSKYIFLAENIPLQKEPFFEFIDSDQMANDRKSALVFIHGYNVSFDDVAKRTAQIHHDLQFKGVPMFYSWPSAGSLSGYISDDGNNSWTEHNVTNFLVDLFKETSFNNIYIIAHSMGNKAMTEAICEASRRYPKIKSKLKEVILAAPDIDADMFNQRIAPALKASCGRVTVYGSANDKALMLSKSIRGNYPRLGDTFVGRPTIQGIDFIDATKVETDFLGHSYIGSSNTILTDVSSILKHGKQARKRGLKAMPARPVPYYSF